MEQIQADLDEYMDGYNWRRTNQGKNCKGRTPMETFQEDIVLCKEYIFENDGRAEGEEIKNALVN